MKTSILVRVQARGGKFLGPDIGYSTVAVRNAQTGQILASGPAGTTGQDSGALSLTVSDSASSGVVLTYPGPQVWYLTANPANPATTAFFQATFDLAEPTLVEISAQARGIASSGTMWIEPGSQLTAEPGYIVTIPGLAVDIIAVKAANGAFAVSAKVTMMCGCPINDLKTDPNGPIQWPSSEFEVWAELRSGGTAVTRGTLDLVETSVYAGSIGWPPASGKYELAVVAIQKRESNVGIATRPMQV